ncbi:MAG: S8 family serine peptidase [Cyanobacteria bacterium P01_H01_bin.105]
MFYQSNEQGPRLVRREPPNYASNQVVITTVPEAANRELPHSLNVAAGTAAAATSYGDASVDGILYRMGVRACSFSRVFVPRTAVPSLTAMRRDRAALATASISADYQSDEDALGFSRTFKVNFETDVNVSQVCQELATSTAVSTARPNYVSRIYASPNDEFYGQQWGLQAINAEAGWDIETGYSDVIIAIVDSGVNLSHEDLKDKILLPESKISDFVDYQGFPNLGWRYTPIGDYQGRDFEPDDDNGHGTHCAGIAAAISNNNLGISGVCQGGKILPVRVMFSVRDNWFGRETGIGFDTDIMPGIKFAVDEGAHVINLSLGGSNGDAYQAVLQYARDNNVCVVAATGNENTSNPPTPSYPAADPNALAVGAVNSALNRASFSNYGQGYAPFVMAPGVDIRSTYKDNSYADLDGTSMATPFVAGLAGLIVSLGLRSGKPFSVDDVYTIIRETATPLGTGKGDSFYGEGFINVPAALQAAKEKLAC